MVNSFAASLDITVIIIFLQEVIKILHVKILKANLNWFHNNASEANKSLNARHNKILNKGFSCLLSSKIFLI